MSERKTPEERARAIAHYAFAEMDRGRATTWIEHQLREAEREAADDALERAANLATGHACKGYCEHDYCVAAHDASSMIRSLKSDGGKR